MECPSALIFSQGGFGIVLENGAGRVLQSYLDYAPLLVRYKSKSGNWDMGPLAQVEVRQLRHHF